MASTRRNREVWDPGEVSRRDTLKGVLRLLRVEHTLFSLPFAYVGALASGYDFSLEDAVLMATAVLGLRSASMSFNNIADLDIDRQNPRTSRRPLVTGVVSVRLAWILVVAGLLVFHASSLLLNFHAFVLSFPIALLALSYPYSKRLHPFPHFHLGLSLGMVVFGGAVAASGDEVARLMDVLATVPWPIVAAVALWVAGFDIVYSIQDLDFDRRMGLGSIPSLLGERKARATALFLHLLALALFLSRYGYHVAKNPFTLVGAATLTLILLLQHFVDDKTAFHLNLLLPFAVLSAELGLHL